MKHTEANNPPAPVAVLVAMRTELRHLLERITLVPALPDAFDPSPPALTDEPGTAHAQLPAPTAPPLAGIWPVWRGHQAGVPVMAVLTGIGPANASGAAGAVLATLRPRAIINYGCAGAHRADLVPGDVIIGDRSINHAAFDLLPDGSERFRGNVATTGPDPMPDSDLASDPALLALAQDCSANWAPEPWPNGALSDESLLREPAVFTGAVASADVWTQSVDRLDILHGRHQTLCEEMEAALIAIVAGRAGVPFLPIKDISNNEYLTTTDLAGAMAEFPLGEVGKRAASLVLRVIARMADERR